MNVHSALLWLASAVVMTSAQASETQPATPQTAISAADQVPSWPQHTRAPASAPNIVLILLDDVGFGDASTFGGAAETPELSKLAAQGLRYNRFHTTGLCSPTRAALLSGRNHHRMGFGTVGEAGYPGYNGIWKKNTASVAEILRRNGYNTAAFGKWHNTPFREISPIGPFERWPTSLGFEYYYGNMLGASSQFEPELWRNTVALPPPKSAKEGYHYTTDIVDDAIRWLHTQRAFARENPYFMYLATGAAHTPHQVPKEWVERYKGRFDRGWNALRAETFERQKSLGVIPRTTMLAPDPVELPAWNDLSSDERKAAAAGMEIYAGFITHTDHELGRLINAVKSAPGGDNTLILYLVGDNGAATGGMTRSMPRPSGGYMTRYLAGWALAGNTPFPWAKGIASHLGGTRNPLVVSWPARIKDKGALRDQYTHVTDIAATVYEAAGITPPASVDGVAQLSLDGASFASSFASARAPSYHRQQYFEIWGNRAIYKDGWLAAARHSLPWKVKSSDEFDSTESYQDDPWELYNLDEDFAQAKNVAQRHPNVLNQLRAAFEAEARRNDVYPLISNDLYFQLPPADRETSFSFPPGTHSPLFNAPQFAAPSAPDTLGNFSIDAKVELPAAGADGLLVSAGSRYVGFALYIKNNALVFEQISPDGARLLQSAAGLPTGPASLRFEFSRATPTSTRATGRLYVNGRITAEANDLATQAPRYGMFSVGEALAASISSAFEAPFKFDGVLEALEINLEPDFQSSSLRYDP